MLLSLGTGRVVLVPPVGLVGSTATEDSVEPELVAVELGVGVGLGVSVVVGPVLGAADVLGVGETVLEPGASVWTVARPLSAAVAGAGGRTLR